MNVMSAASVELDLRGRHVVVTGASGALGGALVEVLAAAGARLHLPVRSKGPRQPAEAEISVVEGVDLTNEASVTAFFSACPPLWASVHVAGGFAEVPLLSASLTAFRGMLDLNLTTAFLWCREAARNMTGRGGRLVNVGARSAQAPTGGSIGYTVAKAGVAAMTLALADELAGDAFGAGIRVNAVLPATIDTPANRAAMPDADPARWRKPAEIALTIAWLISPANTATSGGLVPV
jgi:NAD(P)-dependent dehydrogenase (short-subunit alcohol dehydrogenase family)